MIDAPVSDMDVPEPRFFGRLEVAARAVALLVVAALLFGGLLALVRPWYLNWGASAEERSGTLPGDRFSAGPPYETRAIDIQAPAEQVFAWVSQLGQNRGGFYSYTLLENLVGCEMPNVQHLDPALQQWKVGDKLWMYPSDELGGMGYASLLYYEPGRALVFGTHTPLDPPGDAATGSWSFVVTPTSSGSARLSTRGSGGSTQTWLGHAFTRTVFEPLHFAMERRMLEGIQGLAEGHPYSPGRDLLQLLAWSATFVSLIAAATLVLVGSRPRRRLLGFAAAGVAFQIVTLVQPPPAVGLTLVAVLVWIIWLPSRPASRAGEL
ncbi:MAG TPA: hypothetical protein VMG12_05300, partial [Polyangiaceae bacterium]|nr:hypothetical protein [Polyangiaceae bacterium]